MKSLHAILSFLMLFTSCFAKAQNQSDVIGKVLHVSGSVTIDSQDFFYSEVKLINRSQFPISINTATVQTTTNKSFYQLSKDRLRKISSISTIDLASKDSCIFYFDIPYKHLKDVEPLSFVFTYNNMQDKKYELTVETTFSASEPIVLSAPLKGKNWIAIYNSEWQRGHRRVYYTVNGLARIPGRFAIDFVKLDEKGKLFKNNSDAINDYYTYDEDVLSVEDGTVVSLRNDFKESKTIAGNPGHTESEDAGNYLILQIGKDLYACYEHLKPGSILLKVGDKVSKGDVIAKVGFTGDASEPHLHLHIADKNSVLGAEGLPFVFKEFIYEGIYDDFGNFGKQRWEPLDKAEIKNSLPSRPLSNSVISFPN